MVKDLYDTAPIQKIAMSKVQCQNVFTPRSAGVSNCSRSSSSDVISSNSRSDSFRGNNIFNRGQTVSCIRNFQDRFPKPSGMLSAHLRISPIFHMMRPHHSMRLHLRNLTPLIQCRTKVPQHTCPD